MAVSSLFRRPAGGSVIVYYFQIALCALILLLPAFFNGYPILNPDDNTYLLSGFLPDTPIDRPIAYGLLLRLMSGNGASLWGAVIGQAWCMAWLLHHIIASVTGSQRPLTQIFLVAALAGLSPVAWISGVLLPDICSTIAAMSLALILFGNIRRRSTTITLFTVFSLAIYTHFSHILIFTVLLLIVLLFRKAFFASRVRRGRSRAASLALLLVWAGILTMGSALSKSKYAFAVAAMHGQGLLKPYLDDYCPVTHYPLCDYKDRLPATSDDLLWDARSPLQQGGGWMAHKEECRAIYTGSLTRGKYIRAHIQASLRATMLQTTSFGLGDGWTPFDTSSPLAVTIHHYLPGDWSAFCRSRQQRDDLTPAVGLLNLLINTAVICSVGVIIFFALGFRRRIPAQLWRMSIFFALLILLNNWDCATFSVVNGRYGCRVIWLLPLIAMLFIAVQRRPPSAQVGGGS